MKAFVAVSLLVLLGACAAHQPVPRPEIQPPRWNEPAAPHIANPARQPDADASDRFLRDEIERKTTLAPVAPPPPRYQVPPDPRQSYEPETKRFLDSEIERKTPPPPPPVPEVRYVYERRSYDRPYYSYDPYYYDRSYYYGRRYESSFPWYTAWGAGLGAVIGNQNHHHAGRGAWIGGGIGLLLDIARWHR